GQNKLGQPTIEAQQKSNLEEDISNFLFGRKPLEPSSTSDVMTLYQKLKQLPPDQANLIYRQIARTNPNLANKIKEQIKNDKLGITVQDLRLKALNTKERALELKKIFDSLPDDNQRTQLWYELIRKGVITKEVAKYLYQIYGKR
ncbi:MAG: hypothetical protein ACP5J8_02410, partial [Minisyncoccia bacterium]